VAEGDGLLNHCILLIPWVRIPSISQVIAQVKGLAEPTTACRPSYTPRVGFEPTTYRLTVERSTIELSKIFLMIKKNYKVYKKII
jgi:hypothetical protein